MLRDSWPALFAFITPPAFAALQWLIMIRVTGQWSGGWTFAQWSIGAVLVAVVNFAAGFRVAGTAGLASAVLAVLWWWWRRKRKRLLSLLTGKYRYIRDAMVRVMKERSRPRHVLRPAPGAAR